MTDKIAPRIAGNKSVKRRTQDGRFLSYRSATEELEIETIEDDRLEVARPSYGTEQSFKHIGCPAVGINVIRMELSYTLKTEGSEEVHPEYLYAGPRRPDVCRRLFVKSSCVFSANLQVSSFDEPSRLRFGKERSISQLSFR
jgi:hypothetical protein